LLLPKADDLTIVTCNITHFTRCVGDWRQSRDEWSMWHGNGRPGPAV